MHYYLLGSKLAMLDVSGKLENSAVVTIGGGVKGPSPLHMESI